jgi:hypothetical protein
MNYNHIHLLTRHCHSTDFNILFEYSNNKNILLMFQPS